MHFGRGFLQSSGVSGNGNVIAILSCGLALADFAAGLPGSSGLHGGARSMGALMGQVGR